MQNSFNIGECLRFFIGGFCAVTTDFLLYTLLNYYTSYLEAAKLIAFISGSIVGFFINKYWTFKSQNIIKYEALRYISLYATSAIVNVFVNSVVLDLFSSTLLAFLCATGVSTIINFIGQKFFVFRK